MSLDGKHKYHLVTKDGGYSDWVEVFPAKYKVTETKAPIDPSTGKQYDVNRNIPVQDLTTGGDHEFSVTDGTLPPPPGKLYKETNPDPNDLELVAGNSCYSLKGAEYKLSGTGHEHRWNASRSRSHYDQSHTVSETTSTDEAGNISFSSTVWAGTYTIEETKPSPGYMLPTEDNPQTFTVAANCSSGVGSSGTTTKSWSGVWKEPPRNDPGMLSLTKLQDGRPVPGAVYEIRFFGNQDGSGTPLRTWYFKTDEDGFFSMSLSPLYNDAVYHSDPKYVYDGKYTLPLGTIKCEEVISPEGFAADRTVYMAHIVEDDTKQPYKARFQWEDSGDSLLKTENAATHNEKPTSTIYSLAQGETGVDPDGVNTEQDRITNNHHVLRWSSSGIKETVYCKNLTPGWDYELVGTIMDMETGEQADIDGTRVWKQFHTPGSFTETYNTVDCSVDLDFNINTNLLEGHTLVLFARLYEVSKHQDHATNQMVYYYDPDPDSIASSMEYGYVAHHEDWTDEEETIYVPKMRTSVANNDATFGVKYINPDATSVTLTDTITMSGLKPNTTYTAYGTLMDTEYQEPLLENGRRILGHTTFTIGSSTGQYPNHGVSQTITVTFTFNPQNITGHEGNRRFYKNHLGELRGQDLTVFEHLTLGGYGSPYDMPVVAKHEVYPTLDKQTKGTHAGEEYYDGNVFTDNYHDHNNDDIGDVSEVRQTLRWLGEITLRKRTNAGQVTKEGAYFKLQKWNGTDWVDYICEAGKPMDKWTVSQSPYIVKSDETGIARFTQLKDSPTPTSYSYRVIEIGSPDKGEVGLLKDPIDYVLWRGHSVYAYTPGKEVYTEDAFGNQQRHLVDDGADNDWEENPQNFMDAHRSSTDGYTYVTIFDNGHVVLYAGGAGRKSLYIVGSVMAAILAGLYLGLKIRRKKLIKN